jgi:hypothetical protein
MTMAKRNPRQAQGFSLLLANHELPNMHSSQTRGNWESLQKGTVEDTIWDHRTFIHDWAMTVPMDEYPVILQGDSSFFTTWPQNKRPRYNHPQQAPSFYSTQKADRHR